MPHRKKSTHRRHFDDLRGATKLAVTATAGVTELVETMHRDIASGPDVLGRPLAGPVGMLTKLVYGSIRRVTRVVGAGIDGALAGLEPILGQSKPGPEREAVLAALNGVLGDYLQETGNPLAVNMSLRSDGHVLELNQASLQAAYPAASRKILLMIHGSSMHDGQWTRKGYNHGTLLGSDLGYSVVYVRYNSGLHISTNGKELSTLLEQLIVAWPTPIEELSIVAHSMGGLVARSACFVAENEGAGWRTKLRSIVFLGTPHHGAALERAGNHVDVLLGISKYSAPLVKLGKIRSAGVTDLRYGNILDAHWEGRDRFAFGSDPRSPVPLPKDVSCFAVAGTFAKAMGESIQGDGLVPVKSALGVHAEREMTLNFAAENQWIALATGHLALLDKGDVYAQIHRWLSA